MSFKGIGSLAALAAVVSCNAVAVAGTVHWEFPREGSCHEGMPFADGVTGVLVWGGGDTVNLTVGRGDLWDHRGGYSWTEEQNYSNIVSLVRANDVTKLKSLFVREVPENWNPKGGPWRTRYNPYMLPLGRVTLTLAGATLKGGTLDTATGLGRLTLSNGREIALAMSKSPRLFAVDVPAGIDCSVRFIPVTDFPLYDRLLKWRGFEKAVKSPTGFTWRLPVDESVTLECVGRDGAAGRTYFLRTFRGDRGGPAPDASLRFADVVRDSTKRWSRFWRKGARVKVPDAAVQQMYDFGMYKFGSMTDPDGIPAGLQGQWLEDDRLVPWNGDYHFNVNVQECYSPAFRGGHFANLMPLFRMILSWRDRLRDNARKFVKIEDGYVLPHSVDDRGVCIGGFWTGTIDHASTAWVAAMMYRYVRYSGDKAFLRESAYDFMKGAMNVYLAMMEERGGRLSIPLGPSPEWGASDAREAVGRDPSFQLAAAHRLASDLIAAAGVLGETPDPRWLDVKRRLPVFTSGSGGIHLFEGQPFVRSHRHHSHLAGLYPFDTIPMSEGKNAAVVKESYRTWVLKGPGEWSGWCVPWASILHTHLGNPEAAVHTLHAWKTFFNNPGHGSLHDAYRKGFTIFTGRPEVMQMDGQCGAVTAILEMMAHEVDGKVGFFTGCPDSWKEVYFENLALSDGRRASGTRVHGKVSVTFSEVK